ncbi:MAG: hypothetical protein HYX32_14650 [Actinobacteria bacterium]|nr:hypothetical protein [Actinomycetota bacterium]
MPPSASRTFPAPYQAVFDAAARVLPTLNMKIISADPSQGILNVSANLSLLSWGENVTIRMGSHDNTSTTVSVESAAKVLFTYGKNDRNITKIFEAIASALNQPVPPPTPPPYQQPG